MKRKEVRTVEVKTSERPKTPLLEQRVETTEGDRSIQSMVRREVKGWRFLSVMVTPKKENKKTVTLEYYKFF